MHTILVAEDEKWIRRGIVEMIRNMGDQFQVVAEASNGEEALQLYQKHYPTILITDILMPEKDGLWLLRQIHEHEYPVIRIVISGYESFQYAQQAIMYNVKGYLLKPVSEEDLHKALYKATQDMEQLNAIYPYITEMKLLLERIPKSDPQESSRAYKKYIQTIWGLKGAKPSEFYMIMRIFQHAVQQACSSSNHQVAIEPDWNQLHSIQEYFSLLLELWLKDLARNNNSSSSKIIIEKACEYINKYYMNELQITEMAKMSNLSLSHFSLLMKQVTGLSYTNYLNRVRIEKSKELLLEPDLKIHVIGEMVGYASLSYYFKVFKMITGMSPTEYRKSVGL